ncbi:MAG: hypothetical protein AB7I18_03905 [Candidatus Berkiella sp.]
MSKQAPLSAADLRPYYVRGMPLLKMLGVLILISAGLTLGYELLF